MDQENTRAGLRQPASRSGPAQPGDGWVDLSIPVSEDIPRWQVRFDSVYGGFAHQTSSVTLPIHCATHLDAPRHYIPDGPSVDQFPLELALTEAAVIDLTHVAPNQCILVDDIAPRFPADYPQTILLRTDWPLRAWRKPGFWVDSPTICEDVAVWLAEKKIKIAGYDFPQEEAIKQLAAGEHPCADDFKVHLALLSAGIWQIEYLTNLHLLAAPRAGLIVCPLPLVGLEGSPVRVLGRSL